jgi:hypothetical protein
MTSAGDPEVHVDPALARADGEAAPPLRELEGAPDVPAEARGELLALKSGAVFVCARPDGDVVLLARRGRVSTRRTLAICPSCA